jgi:hypothetical protein
VEALDHRAHEHVAVLAAGPFPAQDGQRALETSFPPEEEHKAGRFFASAYEVEGRELAWERHPEWKDGEVHGLVKETGATYLYRTIHADEERSVRVLLGSDDAVRVFLNGELVHESRAARVAAPGEDRFDVRLSAGENRLLVKVVNFGGEHAFAFELDTETADRMPSALVRALRAEPEDRTGEDEEAIRDWFRSRVSERGGKLYAELAQVRSEREALDIEVPRIPVMAEMEEPRETRVHVKGNFLAQGDPVAPEVPQALGRLPDGAPRDRLGLARWLVSTKNPLTARVTANRLWEGLFGRGLVETSEDFGTRGELPSHPELLDWLAVELADGGWSLKRWLRLVVSSSTYRQSSNVSPELLERDPENRLLARGPRRRVEAEIVRDLALAAAGLLSPEIGGPSVFPPQPDGIWVMIYSDDHWVTATDAGRFRRGIYTFWRRTAPYPTFAMFDAPSREATCTRRPRTNTPLQALATLNDPAFVEAAAGLARRMIREAGPVLDDRARYGFRLCASRVPREDELAVLVELYRSERAHFAERPEEARRLAEGALPTDGFDLVELAAWTVVANALLNLDETLTRS